jgi:hypothetical protein
MKRVLSSLRDKVLRTESKTEEAASAASADARVVGHYEILHTLGKGASGKVSSSAALYFIFIMLSF